MANATVHSIVDGIPDNVPANRAPAASSLNQISGNLVVLSVAPGAYVFYAHLQPGSLRVKAGDRVRTGQVLGLLGNSGNSNAPHLHFQVGDRPSLLFSDGVPYVFDAVVYDGRGRSGELPLRDWTVIFP